MQQCNWNLVWKIEALQFKLIRFTIAHVICNLSCPIWAQIQQQHDRNARSCHAVPAGLFRPLELENLVQDWCDEEDPPMLHGMRRQGYDNLGCRGAEPESWGLRTEKQDDGDDGEDGEVQKGTKAQGAKRQSQQRNQGSWGRKRKRWRKRKSFQRQCCKGRNRRRSQEKDQGRPQRRWPPEEALNQKGALSEPAHDWWKEFLKDFKMMANWSVGPETMDRYGKKVVAPWPATVRVSLEPATVRVALELLSKFIDVGIFAWGWNMNSLPGSGALRQWIAGKRSCCTIASHCESGSWTAFTFHWCWNLLEAGTWPEVLAQDRLGEGHLKAMVAYWWSQFFRLVQLVSQQPNCRRELYFSFYELPLGLDWFLFCCVLFWWITTWLVLFWSIFGSWSLKSEAWPPRDPQQGGPEGRVPNSPSTGTVYGVWCEGGSWWK